MYRVVTIMLVCLSCFQTQSFNSSDGNMTMYLKWLVPDDNITQLSDLPINLGLLHCNTYCNGSKEFRYSIRDSSIPTPTCRQCRCDDDCHKYGDCCPDENGEVTMKIHTNYDCVSSGDNKHYYYGDYLMITSCPDQVKFHKQTTFSGLKMSFACETSPDGVFPVTSFTSNVTYINECIAVCNNETDYNEWEKEVFCGGTENTTDADNRNSSSNCITYINRPLDVPVRHCNLVFSEQKYIDTCNSTGVWNESTFDTDANVQCKEWHYYPVAADGYVFKNIYCFLCNGFMPTITQFISEGFADISINTLIRTFDLDKPQCREDEWYDQIKKECRKMHCRQGYTLKEEVCVMNPVDLPNIQYHLKVVFWSPRHNTTYLQLRDWSNVESMVVQNLPRLLAPFNISHCLFTVFSIVDTVHENTSNIIPTFSLRLIFRTKQNCCRTEFEEHLSKLLMKPWTFAYNDSGFVFILSDKDFHAYDTAESQTYKMMSPDMIPEKSDAMFLEYDEQIVEYVFLPIIRKQCPFVILNAMDFSWNNDKSITLSYVNITIQSDNFTNKDEDRLLICVDTLKDLYSSFNPPLDQVKQAENIVSLAFSVLSLVCLTLTFITYCTFPSLLTIPTKNTMCLVVFLFLAQLLLQFGDLASRDETTCKVIGVLLHYFWLSVIFWMNVCSYHMFHVFVIDAAKPISITSHRTRLLKYVLYANGSPLIIVIITVAATLGATSGNQMGYGNGLCYLSTALLTGVSFVLPLGIILILNIIFFSISVWTMVKIHKMSKTIGQDKSQVHIYMKLSTLTGIFWILSILAETLNLQFLVFISIILNASQGVFIFISYMANRRVYQLWMGKFSHYTGYAREQSSDTTKTSRL